MHPGKSGTSVRCHQLGSLAGASRSEGTGVPALCCTPVLIGELRARDACSGPGGPPMNLTQLDVRDSQQMGACMEEEGILFDEAGAT